MVVNVASRRVMQKAGLKFVRTFHQPWPDEIEGEEEGDVEYVLLRSEWEQQLARPVEGSKTAVPCESEFLTPFSRTEPALSSRPTAATNASSRPRTRSSATTSSADSFTNTASQHEHGLETPHERPPVRAKCRK